MSFTRMNITGLVLVTIVLATESENRGEVNQKSMTRRSSDGLTWNLVRILVDEQRERQNLRKEFRDIKKTLDDVKRELEQKNKNLGDIEFKRKNLIKELKNTKEELKAEFEKYLNEKSVKVDGIVTNLNKAVAGLTKDVADSKKQSGAVYIRWGRLTCPNNTDMIYKGRLGGTLYSHKAGPSNFQCLPNDPDYREHQSGDQGTFIYGGEYELSGYSQRELLHKSYHNYDVVCSVCQSRQNGAQFMIPGKSKCYDGWHMEYRGYLMAGYSGHSASNFICVDAKPDVIRGSNKNDNQATVNIVQSKCGSLKCPPYEDNYELTCVVCTK